MTFLLRVFCSFLSMVFLFVVVSLGVLQILVVVDLLGFLLQQQHHQEFVVSESLFIGFLFMCDLLLCLFLYLQQMIKLIINMRPLNRLASVDAYGRILYIIGELEDEVFLLFSMVKFFSVIKSLSLPLKFFEKFAFKGYVTKGSVDVILQLLFASRSNFPTFVYILLPHVSFTQMFCPLNISVVSFLVTKDGNTSSDSQK